MVKPEWGTKRTCPKCATRFYDLGNADPVTCINCRSTWIPEPVLKSKQPLAFEQSPKEKPEVAKDEELAGEDADLELVEDEETNPDDDVDIGDDDDLSIVSGDDEDEDH